MNVYSALAPNVSPKPCNGVCKIATTKSCIVPNSVKENRIRIRKAAAITIALGTKAAKESVTAGGTPLGILIVQPFLYAKQNNHTPKIAQINAMKIPSGPM